MLLAGDEGHLSYDPSEVRRCSFLSGTHQHLQLFSVVRRGVLLFTNFDKYSLKYAIGYAYSQYTHSSCHHIIHS